MTLALIDSYRKWSENANNSLKRRKQDGESSI